MGIRTPEIPPNSLVGHRASQTLCRVLSAIPVGYAGWLYRAVQVADATRVHECTAGGLVPQAETFPAASPVFGPAGDAATAKGVQSLPPVPPMQSPPSGPGFPGLQP